MIFFQTRKVSAPRERAACFEFWVKAREGIADDADDDGGVVENVGGKDKDEG